MRTSRQINQRGPEKQVNALSQYFSASETIKDFGTVTGSRGYMAVKSTLEIYTSLFNPTSEFQRLQILLQQVAGTQHLSESLFFREQGVSMGINLVQVNYRNDYYLLFRFQF
eukprot:NODE_660_length_5439_cov_0.338577.p4 type:complete len:112 gc:universal NODE_660_length_5439_cov_0.338577:1088-753(-)